MTSCTCYSATCSKGELPRCGNAENVHKITPLDQQNILSPVLSAKLEGHPRALQYSSCNSTSKTIWSANIFPRASVSSPDNNASGASVSNIAKMDILQGPTTLPRTKTGGSANKTQQNTPSTSTTSTTASIPTSVPSAQPFPPCKPTSRPSSSHT